MHELARRIADFTKLPLQESHSVDSWTDAEKNRVIGHVSRKLRLVALIEARHEYGSKILETHTILMAHRSPPSDPHRQTEEQLREVNASLEEQVRLRTAMIEMLHDIASHVHQAASLDEAVQFVLRRVSEFNGWSFGHAFVVSPDDPDQLVPLRAFYEVPAGVFSQFRLLTAELRLSRGVGLPGRALDAGKRVWAENLPDDLLPERADAVQELPIETAAAFPVVVDGRVELALEFFSVHAIENDERLRQGMENVSIHLARTVERLRALATLRENEQRFRELAERMHQVYWVIDVTREQLEYVSPAWSDIVGAAPAELRGDPENWRRYVHPDDRGWVDEEFAAKAHVGQFDVVYRIVRTSGEVRWVHDVAVPIHDESGKVRRILGMAEDVTERRELEREVADAATLEQQRLSRDLHDSIGQELTGLAMMAAKLASDLASTSQEDANAAGELVAGLKRTLQQVRRISRGLAPVDIEAGGLTVALAQLAEQTSLAATSDCVFHCDEPVTISDAGVANHLFRIAQEAVSNAVKHAEARTITVTLRTDGPICELTIEDDGSGLPRTSGSPSVGMGQRTMRYRADLIGGQFRIVSPPSGGTCISCRVRLDGTSV